jgi:hypothetical protein
MAFWMTISAVRVVGYEDLPLLPSSVLPLVLLFLSGVLGLARVLLVMEHCRLLLRLAVRLGRQLVERWHLV